MTNLKILSYLITLNTVTRHRWTRPPDTTDLDPTAWIVTDDPLRTLQTALVDCVKRVGEDILKNRGILRKVEYLGCQPLPTRLPDKVNPKDWSLKAAESNFFLVHFDSSPDYSRQLSEQKLEVDNELIRHMILRKGAVLPEDYECTLDEELQAPAYRKSVQALIQEGRKPERKYETGHFYNC